MKRKNNKQKKRVRINNQNKQTLVNLAWMISEYFIKIIFSYKKYKNSVIDHYKDRRFS